MLRNIRDTHRSGRTTTRSAKCANAALYFGVSILICRVMIWMRRIENLLRSAAPLNTFSQSPASAPPTDDPSETHNTGVASTGQHDVAYVVSEHRNNGTLRPPAAAFDTREGAHAYGESFFPDIDCVRKYNVSRVDYPLGYD
jgi:hypothetical protein